MRIALVAWIALFASGCTAAAMAGIAHFGRISGESRDPSGSARIVLAGPEPGWIALTMNAGVLAMVVAAGGVIVWLARRPKAR
jgi:hypothetical protein